MDRRRFMKEGVGSVLVLPRVKLREFVDYILNLYIGPNGELIVKDIIVKLKERREEERDVVRESNIEIVRKNIAKYFKISNIDKVVITLAFSDRTEILSYGNFTIGETTHGIFEIERKSNNR